MEEVDFAANFRVQQKACATCIYRRDSPLELAKLEGAIKDGHGGFTGWRICHHSKDACCAGFWARWRNHFAMGQIAQRLALVSFVNDDNLTEGLSDDPISCDIYG